MACGDALVEWCQPGRSHHAVLPPWVAGCTLAVREPASAGLERLLETIELPAQMRGASPIRRQEYRLGRLCAEIAMRRLGGPPPPDLRVVRLADGRPSWPAGVTGSITHTRGLVSAVACSLTMARGIGIDAERVMCARTAREVCRLVAADFEVRAAQCGAECEYTSALTLVFAAKEAAFKCLHPLVNRYFDYTDASLVRATAVPREVVLRLDVFLSSEFHRGSEITVRYANDDGVIRTAALV